MSSHSMMLPAPPWRSLRWTRALLFLNVILLSNGLLLNLFSQQLPILRAWKQVLALLLFVPFLAHMRYLTSGWQLPFLRAIRTCITLSIVFVLLLSIRTFPEGFNLVRLSFAVFLYIGFLPFVMLPLVCLNQGRGRSFFTLFGLLGLVLGVGLIFDHFFGFFEVFSIGAASDYWSSLRAGADIRRASFLFESPTAIGYLVNFCLICQLYLVFSEERGGVARLLHVVGITVLVAGAFLTASRQVVATVIFVASFGVLAGIWSRRMVAAKLLYLAMAVILVPVAALVIQSTIVQSEQSGQILERLTSGADRRVAHWVEGLGLFSPENVVGWIMGNGLGDTMGQHAAIGERVHHHYESTIFLVFHEGGWPLLFSFLWPSVAALLILLRQPKSLLKRLLLLYLPCAWVMNFVAPGGLHPTAQMCIYCTVMLAATLPRFEETHQLPYAPVPAAAEFTAPS